MSESEMGGSASGPPTTRGPADVDRPPTATAPEPPARRPDPGGRRRRRPPAKPRIGDTRPAPAVPAKAPAAARHQRVGPAWRAG